MNKLMRFSSKPISMYVISISVLITLIAFSLRNIAQAQDSYIVMPAWDLEGEQVALVSHGAVSIYNIDSRAFTQLKYEMGQIYALEWSSDSTRLAVAISDGHLEIWDVKNKTQLSLFTLDHPANVIAWEPVSSNLLSIGGDVPQNLNVWDPVSGVLLGSFKGGAAINVVYDPTGKYIALHTSLSLYILDAQTYNVLRSSPRVMCCANQMSTLAWSSDSTQIATGSINGLITLWDAETLTPLHQFPANSHYVQDSRDVPDLALSWVRDVAFGVDGSIQAVSGDGTVRLWDTQGNLLQEVQIGQLETASWSPYSMQLAVQIPSQTSTNGLRTVSADTLRIEVPFASLDRLNAIAELCVRDAATQSRAVTGLASQRVTSLDALPDFVAQVESLPEGAIPAACRADLLAVAEALR